MLVLNFPGNPTTQCVDLDFFQKVVDIAREHGIWVVHDLAYADIVFDGYTAPSILQVPGAKDIAVEFFSLSKSYNMPGWRVGFMCGNRTLVAALARIKSYLDYGTFTPIQVAAIAALEGPQDCVREIRDRTSVAATSCARDCMRPAGRSSRPRRPCSSGRASRISSGAHPRPAPGWAARCRWSFPSKLLAEAKVAASPGIGFGEYGDDHVRFGLIENEHRTRQAIRGIKEMFRRESRAGA